HIETIQVLHQVNNVIGIEQHLGGEVAQPLLIFLANARSFLRARGNADAPEEIIEAFTCRERRRLLHVRPRISVRMRLAADENHVPYTILVVSFLEPAQLIRSRVVHRDAVDDGLYATAKDGLGENTRLDALRHLCGARTLPRLFADLGDVDAVDKAM